MAATDYHAIVARFDSLPDAAIVPDAAAAIVLGISKWTLKRRNPVPPFNLSPRLRGRRVGDIRQLRPTTSQQLAIA